MGAACCIAAKDRTIVSRSPGETLQRHARYSPTWSFRWDNRGRVIGEETTTNWLHGGDCRNSHLEAKSGTTVDPAVASREGSSLNSLQSPVRQKSLPSEGNSGISRLQSSGQAVSQSIVEVKEPTDSPSVSFPSPVKLSSSVPSVPSMPVSPASSQNHPLPPNPTSSKWHRHSPRRHLVRQASDSKVPEYKSPTLSISEEPALFLPPAWGSESSRGSNGGSFDSWPIPTFPESMTGRRERWSFDSETSIFSRDKIGRSSGHSSMSPSIDLQTCGICTKLLTERSIWGCASQKIMSNNEVSVAAILTCGHVYHADCLECMTPEIHKYDPPCPVCTYGEKRAVKMSEKALKAELDSKAKKRSRKQRVVDGDLGSDLFDYHKSWIDEKGPKMSSSSSMKSSTGKAPFLKRHFSFGSRATRSSSISGNQSPLRKGFLWTRSSKN